MNTKAAAEAPDLRSGSGTPTELMLEAVEHSFGGIDVLAGISARVEREEVLGVVGPSGCGKSTLLELVSGLTEPGGGRIAIEGRETAPERLARCSYMPQRDLLLPWLRAIDNAGLGLRLTGARRAEARARAQPLFERLGLAGFEEARPAELSGGMRQRVAFARTLLAGRPVLLLDEPFAALDAITRADLQSWLVEALRAEPRTVLLLTHDVEEALYVCDRVLVLSARPARIIWEGRPPRPGRGEPRTEAVTAPEIVRMREEALAALGGSR